jgi:hypothetical protein
MFLVPKDMLRNYFELCKIFMSYTVFVFVNNTWGEGDGVRIG